MQNTEIPKPSLLLDALKSQASILAQAAGFRLLAGILGLASTWYMFEVYGRVVDSRSTTTLLWLTVCVLMLLAWMEVLHWAQSACQAAAAQAFEAELQPIVLAAALRQAQLFPQAVSRQPLQDLRLLRSTLAGTVPAALADLPLAGLFLLLLSLISPWLGLVALIGLLLQGTISWWVQLRTQPSLERADQMALQAQEASTAMLQNAESARAMDMVAALWHRWQRSNSQSLDHHAHVSLMALASQAVTRQVQSIVSSAVLGLGAWLLLNHKLPGGGAAIIVASVLAGRAMMPVTQLFANWRSMGSVRPAWHRLQTLLQHAPSTEAGMPLPGASGRLAVEHLVLAAPGAPLPLVRGIDFRLEPGAVLGVLGPSASGKSSLLRTLAGLWPASGGHVRLDGADVFSWLQSNLGGQIGYLPQTVALSADTLANNVSLSLTPDAGQLRAACELSGLLQWIDTLPKGWDTLLGDGGLILSGGQRQRLGLARAVYGQPKVVLLDEPDAHLDEEGAHHLMQAVQRLAAAGCTVVLVTHRKPMIQVCSHLLVLADGMQQAFGPRDDIMKRMISTNG